VQEQTNQQNYLARGGMVEQIINAGVEVVKGFDEFPRRFLPESSRPALAG